PIYITGFRRNLTMFVVLTQPSKAAADIVNDWDYTGDEAKIAQVVGGDVEAYRRFFGEDPK
ncbi:MAG: hypothetical protein LBK95_02755, partial [Bifidobacteriaceae bacterium]|nr:hypothetical protein [Bifidobacteriaceae bacterium]